MEKNKQTFDEWLNVILDMVQSSPGKIKEEYEDRAFNFNMSPKHFEHFWQNKDSMSEIIDNGENASPTIKNSPGNRTPNFNNLSKRVDKVIYWFGTVAYVRDYNMLPISLIINTDGKRQYNNLLGKDRGTWNYYNTKKEEKMAISFWNKVKKVMDPNISNLTKTKPRLKMIYDRIEKLIKTKKPFSMRDAVPNDIYDVWYNDDEFINVRLKVEDYHSHTGEMTRINNTVNPWVDHNHIKADTIMPLIHDYPNSYNELMLDEIYNESKKHDLFIGNMSDVLNPPHNTVEEYEEIIPWIFTAFKKNGGDSVVKALARKNISNYKKMQVGYENAFRSGVKEFETNIKYIISVSENPQLLKFVEEHKKFLAKKYKNVQRKKQSANITELRLSGWVNFVMVCHDIHHIMLDVYGRAGNERVNTVTTKYFKNAIKLLNDNDIISDLESQNGGTEARYDGFYKKVKMQTTDDLFSTSDFDIEELKDVMIAHMEESGFTPKSKIYDRISSTQFKEIEIDLAKTDLQEINLQEGHLIPTKPLEYGNVITQPPGDNSFNNNKPINDLNQYITDYQIQLEEWFKENNLQSDNEKGMIKYRTLIFIEGWKEQKLFGDVK